MKLDSKLTTLHSPHLAAMVGMSLDDADRTVELLSNHHPNQRVRQRQRRQRPTFRRPRQAFGAQTIRATYEQAQILAALPKIRYLPC